MAIDTLAAEAPDHLAGGGKFPIYFRKRPIGALEPGDIPQRARWLLVRGG